MRKPLSSIALFTFCASLVCLEWYPPGHLGTVREAHAANCGSGGCQSGETCFTCPQDCGICCGNGSCEVGYGEDCGACPVDCGACVCGNGSCEVGETCATCVDCQTGCGDSCCIAPETPGTCPNDCAGSCPDGYCSGAEDPLTCPADCPDVCPDTVCSGAEDADSCPADCATPPNAFGLCPYDLADCTDTYNDCCKRPFDPIGTDRAIVIPMDRCHQRFAQSGTLAPPGAGSPTWCSDTFAKDNGIISSYGLVYRLMQAGIPIYWVINPTKEPQGRSSDVATDIDLWVLSPDGTGGFAPPPDLGDPLTALGGWVAPVHHLNPATLASDAIYSKREFPVRGSAFVIAAEDRPEFNKFWLKQAPYDVAPYTGARYVFDDVDMFEVQTDAVVAYQKFNEPVGAGWTVVPLAPVNVTIDYPPPRLVKLTGGPSDNWLGEANLDQQATNADCLSAPFQPSDAVYCDIDDTEVSAGLLNTADATWAWMDHGGFSCADMDEFTEFMTAEPGVKNGGSVLFMEAVVTDAESCHSPAKEIMGKLGTGLVTQSSAIAGPYIQRYPSHPFAQWGDFPVDFASGSVSGWNYFGGGADGYQPHSSLVRLVTADTDNMCAQNKSTPTCDFFNGSEDIQDLAAYIRYDDVPENGIAMYCGGNNITQAGNIGHLRMVMNALISMPASVIKSTLDDPNDPTILETARSTPVLALVDGVEAQYQGTFMRKTVAGLIPTYSGAADAGTFVFPFTTGHFRAIDVATITEGTATGYAGITSVFDAADHIPSTNAAGCSSSAFTSSCRTVFTNTTQGGDRIFFDTSNSSVLRPLLQGAVNLTTDETNFLISRVLAGHPPNGPFAYQPALGGVDRSAPAIIPPSPLIGVERPTIAYFGGLDGMLHAVCADTTGACAVAGQELWAYIPRTQLPRLRLNTQRVDGSPKVIDVFGDFNTDGQREWRTVLVFQTGAGDPLDAAEYSAIIALDITDPTDPQILWELATPGVGIDIAMGPTQVGTELRYVAYATTNRGSASAGFTLYAIDVVTGDTVWTADELYPTTTRNGAPQVPQSGLPGGPTGFAMVGSNEFTHVVVPTLYGDLWLFEAGTGTNPHGDEPLFRMASDYHPIGVSASLYRDLSGAMHALVGTGGYVDPLGLTTWAPIDQNQYVVSFRLEVPSGSGPISDTGVGTYRDFVIDLGVGNRVFAQPTVSGNELFVVTDSGDVNDLGTWGVSGSTGMLNRYSLTNGAQKGSSVVLLGGASSVDVSGGVVYAGAGTGAQKTNVSSDFDDSGVATELTFEAKKGRKLWLQLD